MSLWDKLVRILGRKEEPKPAVHKKRLSKGFSNEDLNEIYDKNGGYCWHCQKKLSFNNYGRLGAKGAWEVDHSHPLSRGGTDSFRNWVPSCIPCNRSKGDLSSSEFS